MGYHDKEDRGFIGFIGRLLNRTNSFNVTYFNIDKKDIDVVWDCEKYKSDTLVKDGVIKDNINYAYGKESFIVFYKDSILSIDGLLSLNNNDPHDVEINISKTNEGYQVCYIIDHEKWTVYLDNQRKRLISE